MLKIQRSSNEEVIYTLSGRMQADDVDELQRVFESESIGHHLVLDLKDLTLVDREGVKFLARCVANNMALANCPAYIREWIAKEEGNKQRLGDN